MTTMDVVLARQLKEAGLDTRGGAPACQYFVIDGERYRAPTLEELIEACGEYVYLLPLDDGWGAGKSTRPFERKFRFNTKAIGDTPQEAVARLYVALHGTKEASE
jgi:hypothetical protein